MPDSNTIKTMIAVVCVRDADVGSLDFTINLESALLPKLF